MNNYKTALYNITETDDVDKRIEYRSLLQELVEKATPKKYKEKTEYVDEVKWTHAICPNCKEEIDDFGEYDYCPYCGQALDWSDEEMEKDKKKFEELGIIDGVTFEIKELVGNFKLDLENKVIKDYKHNPKGVVVRGLYENLLRGAWHKE